MSATTKAIIHGAVSGIKRRVVIPDSDAEHAEIAARLQPGEAMIVVPHTDVYPAVITAAHKAAAISVHEGPAAKAAPAGQVASTGGIAIVNGVTPPGQLTDPSRCAIVDKNGDVVGIANCDPLLDSVAEGVLIQSDLAIPGWKWDGSAFIAPAPIKVVAP